MFNEEFKNKFLADITNSEDVRRYFRILFSNSECFEVKYKKDLCEFTNDEMRDFYSKHSKMQKSSNRSFQAHIKRYLNYCSNNGMRVVCNNIRDCVGKASSDTILMRERMVFDPSYLNAYMDIVFGDIEDHTESIRFRCLYWMAFMGIEFDDAKHIRNSNVDTDSMMITYNGIEHQMYKESINAFVLAKTLKSFAVINPRTPGKISFRDRHIGDLILRGAKRPNYGTEKENGGIEDIKQSINRKLKAAEGNKLVTVRLTYDNIMYSGLFYRTYIREQNGIKPAFKTIVLSEMARKQKGSVDNSTITYAVDNLSSNYNAWKQAYQMYLADPHM